MIWKPLTLVLGATSALAFVSSPGQVATMPVEEIEAGMVGEWHTVVSGTEIEVFALQVLGVSTNFLGPGRPVIIAEATEAVSIESGPVAGMSGSPVYIDGKLVGAYAFGYAWPKAQTIVGITPIAQMLELFDLEEHRRSLEETGATGGGLRQGLGTVPVESATPVSTRTIEAPLQPLPTPMIAGGFSRETLDAFADEFAELGIEVMQGPLGQMSLENYSADDLQAGSAVAGVIMTGDFNIAGTGTVTWRDGDDILAFGHPMFKFGNVDMPMAAAEIITVIRTLNRSFKLSNLGPLIGTFYQDRLTAISGTIGEVAPMADLTIRTNTGFEGTSEDFQAHLYTHPMLGGLFASVAVRQALTQTMGSDDRETISLRMRVEGEEFEPLYIEDASTGLGAVGALTSRFMRRMEEIFDNGFLVPTVTSIDVEIDVQNYFEGCGLQSMRVETPFVRPGENLEIVLELWEYQNGTRTERVTIPVPESVPPGTPLEVLVAQASVAEAAAAPGQAGVQDFAALVDTLRDLRSPENLYVMLLQPAAGLRANGQEMPSLPPSILERMQAPPTSYVREPLPSRVLWETSIDVPGIYFGDFRQTIFLSR